MGELSASLARHNHDPALGAAPVRWECIEGRPEPGAFERVYTMEATQPPGAMPVPQAVRLPDRAHYNAGYGLVSVTEDGRPLARGMGWIELLRPEGAAGESARYWADSIQIARPMPGSVYRVTWRNITLPDYIRGLRLVHIDAHGAMHTPHGLSSLKPPNGVTWNALPDGYRAEIWRKTKYPSRRWVLYASVPAGARGTELRGNRRSYAFCFSFLRPDGARSLLSRETVIFRPGAEWREVFLQ